MENIIYTNLEVCHSNFRVVSLQLRVISLRWNTELPSNGRLNGKGGFYKLPRELVVGPFFFWPMLDLLRVWKKKEHDARKKDQGPGKVKSSVMVSCGIVKSTY